MGIRVLELLRVRLYSADRVWFSKIVVTVVEQSGGMYFVCLHVRCSQRTHDREGLLSYSCGLESRV